MYGSRSSKTTVLSDMYRLEKSLIGSNVKGRRYYGPNSGSEEVQVTEQDVADIELEDLREENFSEFNEAVSDASAPLIEETEDKRDIMDPSFFFDDKEISKYGNRPVSLRNTYIIVSFLIIIYFAFILSFSGTSSLSWSSSTSWCEGKIILSQNRYHGVEPIRCG